MMILFSIFMCFCTISSCLVILAFAFQKITEEENQPNLFVDSNIELIDVNEIEIEIEEAAKWNN